MANGDRLLMARPVFRVDDQVLKYMESNGLERKVQDAVFKIAQRARDMARRKAPSRTGALRASIYATKGKDPGPSGGGYTKQSTTAYFRAMNSAVAKNEYSLTKFDSETVHPTTQRIKPDMLDAFSVGKTTIATHSFKTFAHFGEDDDGKFAMSVPSVMEMGAAGRNAFFVTVGVGAYYGGFVEFGHVTRGHLGTVPPRPFFTPAMEWAAAETPNAIRAIFAEKT